MDLTAALSGMQQVKTANAVQTRVAQKVLDAQRDQGAAAIQLLRGATGGAAQPGDALAAAATGLGGAVDTYG